VSERPDCNAASRLAYSFRWLDMTQTFSLSTTQAVIDDKVSKLERATDKLREQMDEMLKVDEEIMEQHEHYLML